MIKSSIFLTKTVDLWKISIIWTFLKLLFSGLKSILFYLEYQKMIFSGLICPKNTDDKKFRFLTKTMELWKISVFWSFLKLPFSGLKRIFFYPKHKKTIFSYLICAKNKDNKIFDFLTSPSKKFDLFDFFKSFFPSLKIILFLSRILKTDIFLPDLPKKQG